MNANDSSTLKPYVYAWYAHAKRVKHFEFEYIDGKDVYKVHRYVHIYQIVASIYYRYRESFKLHCACSHSGGLLVNGIKQGNVSRVKFSTNPLHNSVYWYLYVLCLQYNT